MSRPVLDLKNYAFVHDRGDLRIFGTWYGGGDGAETRTPALVIVPANRRLSHETVRPCIVQLANAWMWRPDNNGDPAYVAGMTIAFAGTLGMDPSNRMTLIRITTLIQDHLDDLIRMKPEPENAKRVAAEIIHRDPETGVETHAEVMDYVG